MGAADLPANPEPFGVAGSAALLPTAQARGRRLEELSIVVAPYMQPTTDLDSIERYRDAGVDQVVFMAPLAESATEVRNAIESLGEAIVAPAARI